MHMIFRFLLLYLTRKSKKPLAFDEMNEVTMRVLPTDLDFLWHVNNGVYFSYMDFGRMDMIFRNGIYQLCQKMGWYGVVASESIKFKRSLQLWDKFTIQTKTVAKDDKYFFIEQKIFSRGHLMSTGLVKIRFLKKSGGTVGVDEILSHFKNIPKDHHQELSLDWQSLESKYLV
ncbi:MAG: acyl-CoA thioesterase [Bacteriovoracaceae bacterium]